MPWPHFADVLLEMRASIGRIEGRLQANTERLDRMDQRTGRIEERVNSQRMKPADLLPWVYGVIILASAAFGKVTLLEALGLLKSGH